MAHDVSAILNRRGVFTIYLLTYLLTYLHTDLEVSDEREAECA